MLRIHGPVNLRCEGSSNLPQASVSAHPTLLPAPRPSSTPPSSSASSSSLPSSSNVLQPALNPTSSASPGDALPSLDCILGVHVPTFHHVPKGARNAWAGLVGRVLHSICSEPSDVGAWCKLFMLARCILANPARGGHSRWRDTQECVRARIRRWRAGELTGLWAEVVAADGKLKQRRSRPKGATSESLQAANARCAHRVVEAGQYRKAIQFLSSAGLAQASIEVVNEMRAKHPQADPPSIPPAPTPPPVQVSGGDVIRALRSFPSDSAPGPSNFRASHFKEAVLCPSPDQANYALQGLLGVVNLLCGGHAPLEVVPHLCGASLFACRKKGGGLRPIAIGEVLRHVVSKCVSRAVRADATGVLSPLQVGVGVPAGCEAIVHSVSCVLEDPSIPPDERCIIVVDFSNAFNSVDRDGMFKEVRACILLGWRVAMVRSPSFIWMTTPSSAAVVFSREIPWVLCALPYRCTPSLRGSRRKFQVF